MTKELHDMMISFRLTQSEYDFIIKEAKTNGTSKGNVIRSLIQTQITAQRADP